VGTLVSSLYFRQPVTLAKAAVTVDHLCAGRLELALGVGDPSAGAGAAGIDWSAAERVARFRESSSVTAITTLPPASTSTTRTTSGGPYSVYTAAFMPAR